MENLREKKKPITKFEQSREAKEFFERKLSLQDSLENFGNPYFIPHDSALRDKSVMGGKEVINFGSYNYLCLSGDPKVNEAANKALYDYGTSASGSRLLAGEKTLHKKLEETIADWKHTEDAIVLVGGHSTNVTFIGNFCNENDLILYDVIIHNSITEGLKMTKAVTKRFPHNDYNRLERIIEKNRDNYEKILIVVEGVYSMDGDVAPIDQFVRIKKKYGCFLMVDEAHSAGVIGQTGRGVDEYFNLEADDIDIKMGTLSKALGACGGYLAGSKVLIEYLRYNLPGFVFSVGLSPVLAGAVMESINIIQSDNSRVRKLHDNISFFLSEAKKRGLDTMLAKDSAITPILIGKDEDAFVLSMIMQEEGVFVPPAVYPAVPKGKARLRYCLNSMHTHEQISYALDLLVNKIEQLGITI